MTRNELFPQLHQAQLQKKQRRFTTTAILFLVSILFLTLSAGNVHAEESKKKSKILPPTGGPQTLLPLPSALLPAGDPAKGLERTVITDPGSQPLPLPPVAPVPERLEGVPTRKAEDVVKKEAAEKKVAKKVKKKKAKEVPAEEETVVDSMFQVSGVEQPFMFTIDSEHLVETTRQQKPLIQETRSLSVITSDEILAQGDYRLGESLRNVPGLRVRTQGPVGDFTAIYIRGNRSFDTALLVDGLPFRDAADPQGAATPFFQDAFVDKFEVIEVVRGTASTLYGSEAIGGVINLQMKRGEIGRPKAKASFEGGSYGTLKHSYQISGGAEKADYFVQYSRIQSDGIKSVDGYRAHDYAVNIGVKPFENVEGRFIVNANQSISDLNNGPTALPTGQLVEDSTDPNNLRRARFIHYVSSLTHTINENAEHTVKFGYTDSERRFINDVDAADTSSSDNQYQGNISNLEYAADVSLGEHVKVTIGAEHEREEMVQISSGKSSFSFTPPTKDKFAVYRLGGFAQATASALEDTLQVTAGGRLMHHEKSHTNPSGEVSASYLFRPTNTRLKGHFGTGFREPSLFELYGVFHSGALTFPLGNPNLKNEKSLSWDAGFEQRLIGDKVKVAANVFATEYSKRIAFLGGTYTFVDGGYTRGAELEAEFHPFDNMTIKGSYTRTMGELDGESLVNIPRNMFGLDFFWRLHERVDIGVNLSHRGREQTVIFGGAPTFPRLLLSEGSYTKVDAKLGVRVSDNLTVWLRGDNIFGAEFVEAGFRNPGAQFYGGTSVEL
ncbi:MAG: TonB-dependent receptor [Candidatus Omnitrophota bacterium]|nr:TonB-dependent receptor [Candidatus Omnitrophota bacterium]